MSHTSAEYDQLDSLLRDWGRWQETHCEDAVLPTQSSFLAIPSDQPSGSRVLCADMSKSVYLIHCAILTLRIRYQQSLFVWYAVQICDRGGYWTIAGKAQIFGCSENALRLRVGRARRVLMRKYPGLAAFGLRRKAPKARTLQKRQLDGIPHGTVESCLCPS